jgi:hypothetical protein
VVDALDVGQTLTDTFTVHSIDGTTQVVTISIHGASDADPNDFDDLAVGTVVISDPPFVYGTPGSDSIAGGGNTGQIIYGGAGNDTLNGTGVNDIIYGGSGNDTFKGNGGDDTIYGGSGADTTNGNNGNDTIIGGFGADHLTGSNGDDVFVYLSVADSNASHFDTITDFASGSDKINLTALGALAFSILALTPTSTSVPAHTIAWVYDSAANETIVYVNPTDETLRIGDSDLLEIHLQGIATIESSDFILAPTTAAATVANDAIDLAATVQNDAIVATSATADTSSDTTASGVPLVDANWTAQPTSASYFIDAALKQIDSTDYPESLALNEVQAHSTEYAADHIAMAPLSGRPAELPHVAIAAQILPSFAFDQMPAVNSADWTTIGHGGVAHGLPLENSDWILPSESNREPDSDTSLKHEGHGPSATGNTGATNETNTPPTVDTGPHGVANAGVPSENGGGNHSISGEVGQHAAASVHGPGVHDIDPPPIGHVVFGEPSSRLEASFHFKNEISTPGASGVIGDAESAPPSGMNSHDENAPRTHGPEAISEAAQTTELTPLAQHSVDPFDIVANHTGGTAVTHMQHDLIV